MAAILSSASYLPSQVNKRFREHSAPLLWKTYINYIWSLRFGPSCCSYSFVTLMLCVRGYVHLANKYDGSLLKIGAYIFIFAEPAMYLVILMDAFQWVTNADTRLAHGITCLVIAIEPAKCILGAPLC